ncbi:hypothetical protein HOT57_gp94 [Pseudomonas phage phCDa]|uniref:Uncharacterized protein n=1 Tax=Pseudomonas phage phCDa TaxID=2268587 RepID=A0A2Z5HA96_9CAUD|nr:hypothetical protein HOT57_gp94 [Pseudomonas phage phCDa]AXC36538.1 hypothetical protein phCDa_94 [Pseudomonas phage phCDa]
MNLQDEYPNLAASLGQSGTDRVNMHLQRDYAPSSNRVRFLHNPHHQRFAFFKRLGDNPLIENIVTGVCTLDHGSGGNLSPTRLFVVLSYMESISSEHLASVLCLSDRQARRYMAAAKLVILRMTKHLAPRVLVRHEPSLAELRRLHQLKKETVHAVQHECP